jgi:hypothetical protein
MVSAAEAHLVEGQLRLFRSTLNKVIIIIIIIIIIIMIIICIKKVSACVFWYS